MAIKTILIQLLIMLGVITPSYIDESSIHIVGGDVEDINGIISKNKTYYTKVVNRHIHELVKLGYEYREDIVEGIEFRLDVSNITGGVGGYYAEKGVGYSDHESYDKHVIGVYLRELNKGLESDMEYTILHEFGHYIGHKYTHTGGDFTLFNTIRGGVNYAVNDSHEHYSTEWRNNIIEQYADTYAEVFIDGYVNVTASPELNNNQKELYKEHIIMKLNTYTE